MESLRVAAFATFASLVLIVMSGSLRAHPGTEPHRDMWVHPEASETFDAKRHYRAADGEVYYKAENDIENGLGQVRLGTGPDEVPVSIDMGNDLFEVVRKSGGYLQPVLLVDTNDDGRVDRTVYGKVRGRTAEYDSPLLRDRDLRRAIWQIGVRYRKGANGTLDREGDYLASVASDDAQIAWGDAPLPPIAASGPPVLPLPALIILKHQEGKPFDLRAFAENPARYTEDFDELTRAEDMDDWTVNEDGNRVRTHFDEEDLFMVRTNRGLDLDVEWGDMPLIAYMEEQLEVTPDAQGCYTSFRTALRNHDGTVTDVPQRLLYCPGDNVALFDVPDGYQVGVVALDAGEPVEDVELSTSIRDNIRLYAKEVHPRRPSSRATGTVSGNIRAGFDDAGADLGDAFRHTVLGTYPQNIHTGQTKYRPSLLTGIPFALAALVTGKPGDAVSYVFDGAAAGVDAVANTASALTNGVINPLVQGSVGALASPGAADATGDMIGVLPQVAAKNLPFGERSVDAVSPVSAWQHNRGFEPRYYTRTDTQLNIDRVATVLDLVAIQAIRNHNESHSNRRRGTVEEPDPDPCMKDPKWCKKPPKMKPPKMRPPKPPKMKPPKMKMPKHPKMKPPKWKPPFKHGGHLKKLKHVKKVKHVKVVKHGKHVKKVTTITKITKTKHVKVVKHGKHVKKVTTVKTVKVVTKVKNVCLSALKRFGW